jgi:hypothetical protein
LSIQPTCEIRKHTPHVGQDQVVVIAHYACCVKLDAVLLSRDGKAVDKDVVDGSVRAKQKTPSKASPGQHVGRVGQDAAWQGHASVSAIGLKSCVKSNLGRFWWVGCVAERGGPVI